jgi:two-component sensor histidine kinase
MHPILRDWRRFLVWMAAWIPIGAILTVVARLSGHLRTGEAIAVMLPTTLVMSFVCLSPFYVCRASPLRSASKGKLILNHVGAAFVLAGGVMLVGRFAASLLAPTFPGIDSGFASAAPMLALMILMIYEMSVALHYAALELEASRRAEILAREAQLKALKAQVNPHFLFNSLNSISALTTIDAGEARQMCIRLADFLRTSLRLGERSSISFSEELALTRMYLDVEQVRFGGKLRLVQDVDPACDTCDVPALIIQPLVENAVKHGIAMMAEGGEIVISGRRDRDLLRFTITNPFDPEAPSTGRNGLGLRNIGERLESRYGTAARLEIKVEDRLYRVTLTLPAKAAGTGMS